MPPKSDLPFGSEFSPSQIELPVLLDLAAAHGGDFKRLEAEIRARFFSMHGGGSAKNQQTLAMNCRLGMKAYGLIDDDANLTDLGRELHAVKDDEPRLYETLARHILLNLKGMALVQCIRDMTVAGEAVTLPSLREALALRGIHHPSGGKHPSMMRLWLAKAGVFVGKRWQLDERRLRDVLGTNPDDFGVLSRFTAEQRAFLLALANTGVTEPQPANEIAKLAAAIYGVKFPEKSLPKVVLSALVDAGYITAQKTTSGQQKDRWVVMPMPRLIADVATPLLEQLETRIDPKLAGMLHRPLADVLDGITSGHRHTARLALEALAFKLMHMLDMQYVATRLRAQTPRGAEIDLVFESARLVFSRWQVQCKNTPHVSIEDVAKEVGLTYLLKGNVIVLVSTGNIDTEARRYANKIMADTALCIVMIDRMDLEALRTNPVMLLRAFSREAGNARILKQAAM